MRGASIYHTPRDAIEVVNVNGLAHHGSLALGIARNFGSLEVGASAGDGAVFFTVPFDVIVRYSAAAAIVSLVVALLLVAVALWRRVASGSTSVGALLSGFGLVLLAAFGSAVVSTLVWVGLVNLRPEMGMVEGYAYLVVLIGLTGGAWYVAQRRSAARGGDAAGGVLIVWLLFALLLGSFLPAVGYLFVWPAIAVGVAELIAARSRSYWAELTGVVIVVLTTFVVLVPAIDVFFSFASPRPGNPDSEMPVAIVVPVMLAFLAIGLVASTASRRSVDAPSE
jgi:hypothetical protein